MNDVYAVPSAALAGHGGSANTGLFALGRIGRARWFGYCVIAGVLKTLVLGGLVVVLLPVTQIPAGVTIGVAVAIYLAIFGIISSRRLHDTGAPSWMLILSIIPIVSLYFTYLMMFKRGDPGANRYGPAPSS